MNAVNMVPMKEGQLVFRDLTYTFQNVPEEMVGGTYFQQEGMSETTSDDCHIRLFLPEVSDIYVLILMPFRDAGFLDTLLYQENWTWSASMVYSSDVEPEQGMRESCYQDASVDDPNPRCEHAVVVAKTEHCIGDVVLPRTTFRAATFTGGIVVKPRGLPAPIVSGTGTGSSTRMQNGTRAFLGLDVTYDYVPDMVAGGVPRHACRKAFQISSNLDETFHKFRPST